jgi:cobyrinic acid a,c-diamide synthase
MTDQKRQIPRLVIAGGSSGSGKTTMTLALAGYFQAQGLKVACFKCGPDYLDPTYHRLQTGDCQNLDGWMMGREAVLDTFYRQTADADIALIEGVMGLFDSAGPRTEQGSTAQIAKWLDAPVLVTIHAGGMARTLDAISLGLRDYDPDLQVAGVLLNYLGSPRHLTILREACQSLPVYGGLPRSANLAFPERHLGLVAALNQESQTKQALAELADIADEWLDGDRLGQLAASAPALPPRATDQTPAQPSCRIAYAFDDCFHFYYEDNLSRLRQAGAELIPFSPLHDQQLPDCDGLYLGGGYPELYASQLAENVSMRQAIYQFMNEDRPIYAECGGFMYLCQNLIDRDHQPYPMVGIFPAKVRMHDKLQALGYTEVEVQQPTILGGAGLRFRGHQFRYSSLEDADDAIVQVYRLKKRRGKSVEQEGFWRRNTLGSYVHAHWASNPQICRHLVRTCQTLAEGSRS